VTPPSPRGAARPHDCTPSRTVRPAIIASAARFADPPSRAATPAEGCAACCEAIGALDVRDRLGDIAAPTLVVAGAEDPATPGDTVRLLADDIPDSAFTVVPGAAHLPDATHPQAVDAALREHLGG
jgi:pimeloyl-ACP methyl ester carboxylesterase